MFKYNHPYTQPANLNADVKLVTLLGNISKTQAEIVGTQQQDVVLLLGATGAGKSTFINYLANAAMMLDAQKNVTCNNPVTEIGHSMNACTLKPFIFIDSNLPFAVCDCPGFFDTRGSDVEIINAFAIQSVANKSKNVKSIILMVDYESFYGARGQMTEAALQTTFGFLGGNPQDYLNSVFILFSKVSDKKVDKILNCIADPSNQLPIIQALARIGNIGFYHPMNKLTQNGRPIYQRDNLITKIAQLPGIKQNNFKVAVSAQAKLEMTGLVNLVGIRIRQNLAKAEYASLPQSLSLIHALNEVSLSNESEKIDTMVTDQIKLCEHQENGKQRLEELKKIMPQDFQPVIEQTLANVMKRLEKERLQAVEMQKTKDNLQQSKQDIQQLQGEQSKLQQDLHTAKISQQEYEKQNQQLQQQITHAQQAYQNTEKRMGTLQSELNASRAEAKQREAGLMQKVEEAERKADQRVAKLQSELQQSRETKSSEPTLIIWPHAPFFMDPRSRLQLFNFDPCIRR